MTAAVVRHAVTDDATALIELIRAHALYERGIANCDIRQLTQVLEATHPPAHILVATVAEKPVGYTSISLDFSLWRCHPWAHLDCLFVLEEWRGAAIGAALFSRAREYATRTGADHMEWQSPLWNVDAARFYRRQGATHGRKERFVLPLL